jgi:hypothetical protein
MKNTLLQNVISNFDLMDNQHFLDWFKESKQWMLEQERLQNESVAIDMVNISIDRGGKEGVSMENEFNKYYSSAFCRSVLL